jgi:DNA ligase-1
MKETLYQLDQSGNVKVWIITVKNNITSSSVVVESGRLNGSLVFNISTVNEGKNIGKSNETNHYEQACLEATSKVEEKLRKGYVRDLSNVKSSTMLGSGIPSPMLAHKHSPDGSQSSSKTLKQIGILGKEIAVQPKLDGNRCLIVVESGMPKMYTRKGDLMPVQLEHILNDVKSHLGGVKDIILDGELFSSEISFNTLNGLIKRIKVTAEDVANRLKIKYHLYDTISQDGYETRSQLLQDFASENILIVPTLYITATDENIKKHLEQFLSEGHEGLMIRQLGTGYESKRSWQLIKVKLFEDAEYKLVGFVEDVRGGFVGAFTMEMKDGTTFNAGASGQSVDERTEMWYNQDKYFGKMATVEFFGLSEYNVPRFPKYKGLRNG